MQAQYRPVMCAEGLPRVEEILETRARESWFEVVREAGVFLAKVMEEGSGEVAKVKMVEGEADSGAQMAADEAC
jgi:hypothetical protein